MKETDNIFRSIQESNACLLGIDATLWSEATANHRIPSQIELSQFWTHIQFMRDKELVLFNDAYIVLTDQQIEEIFMAYSRKIFNKKKE